MKNVLVYDIQLPQKNSSDSTMLDDIRIKHLAVRDRGLSLYLILMIILATIAHTRRLNMVKWNIIGHSDTVNFAI